MKRQEELLGIQDKMKSVMSIRTAEHADKKVFVGMGTVGINAGARDVLHALTDAFYNKEILDVRLQQDGYLDMPGYEPVVVIEMPNKEKVTYVHVSAEKIAKIVDEHIIGGKPVAEYTLENASKS